MTEEIAATAEGIKAIDYVTLILTSSLIATLATSALAFWLNKIQFRNEYYKLVIQKRIEAYEILNDLVNDLQSLILNDPPYLTRFDEGKDGLALLHSKIKRLYDHRIWINHDSFAHVSNILKILNAIYIDLGNDLDNNKRVIQLGQKYHNNIFNEGGKLAIQIREDILKLHKIKKISFYS